MVSFFQSKPNAHSVHLKTASWIKALRWADWMTEVVTSKRGKQTTVYFHSQAILTAGERNSRIRQKLKQDHRLDNTFVSSASRDLSCTNKCKACSNTGKSYVYSNSSVRTIAAVFLLVHRLKSCLHVISRLHALILERGNTYETD